MFIRLAYRSFGPVLRGIALGAVLLVPAFALVPALPVAAQQAAPCVDCVLYAYTDLNLRKGPAIDAVVLARVPRAAAVRRTTGAEVNGYAPVTYAGIPGWVVALGLVASPAEVEPDAAPAPTAAPAAPAPAPPAASANQRVTLAPLNLRAGPSPDAALVGMLPAGTVVTLTGAGAEGGYVTVDANGTPGWLLADLIGPVA
jgi:uncharacterized protein YraI